MADKSSFYRERAKALEKRLEHEQEWETYFPGITNYDRRPVLVHTFSVRTPDGAPRGEGSIHYIRFEVLGAAL